MRIILMKFLLILCQVLPFVTISQNELLVNGQSVGSDCTKIIIIDTKLDTLNTQRVKVYHAEITNNCLELGIIYAECNANIELVTDNQLIESQSLKLYFLLKYIEPVNCKATIKTKVSFDLLPFKNLRTGHYIIVSLVGENYNLIYK